MSLSFFPNFALREEDFAHLSQRCQPQLPTSLYRPPDVFIGLRSLLRWWNFLGFPAWKRNIQLISGCKPPYLTTPRATHPITPAPLHPHRPEGEAALGAPPPLDSARARRTRCTVWKVVAPEIETRAHSHLVGRRLELASSLHCRSSWNFAPVRAAPGY